MAFSHHFQASIFFLRQLTAYKFLITLLFVISIFVPSYYTSISYVLKSALLCAVASLRPVPLRAWKKAFFVCFIDFFFALASILTARFNRRSIKERKNALFHARSGNGPLNNLFKKNSRLEQKKAELRKRFWLRMLKKARY